MRAPQKRERRVYLSLLLPPDAQQSHDALQVADDPLHRVYVQRRLPPASDPQSVNRLSQVNATANKSYSNLS
jgi:hypothetical protein